MLVSLAAVEQVILRNTDANKLRGLPSLGTALKYIFAIFVNHLMKTQIFLSSLKFSDVES